MLKIKFVLNNIPSLKTWIFEKHGIKTKVINIRVQQERLLPQNFFIDFQLKKCLEILKLYKFVQFCIILKQNVLDQPLKQNIT